MSQQIIFGLIAEGTTDIKFLRNVIHRTVSDLSWECDGEFDIYDIQIISANGDTFVSKMMDALRKSFTRTHALCIHTDADAKSIENVMQWKFNPLIAAVQESDDVNLCKVIVPTIPVRMIEAWMLADTHLLKHFINAENCSDSVLGIDKNPESYADPKSVINDAIRIAFSSQTKRKRSQMTVEDLYETIGNSIPLDSLRRLYSFRIFEDNVRQAFRQLNLLH